VRFAEVRLPGIPAPFSGLEVRLPDGTQLRGGSAVELATLVRALTIKLARPDNSETKLGSNIP
jgi:hypothetical protein